MNNKTTLNGWVRIWIVLTVFWALMCLLNTRPFPDSPIDTLRSDTLALIKVDDSAVDVNDGLVSSKEIVAILEKHMQIISAVKEANEDEIFEMLQALYKTAPSGAEHINEIKERYDYNDENWPKEVFDWLKNLLIQVASAPAALYIIGFLINFIRRGFVN